MTDTDPLAVLRAITAEQWDELELAPFVAATYISDRDAHEDLAKVVRVLAAARALAERPTPTCAGCETTEANVMFALEHGPGSFVVSGTEWSEVAIFPETAEDEPLAYGAGETFAEAIAASCAAWAPVDGGA